ncbi:uncharacterized protein [Miscanthus floridulus]|uniref:uncharacterized protein n=1 Tax=Miscanthus floridulus TaxID=154761 RepID=UPI00345A2578
MPPPLPLLLQRRVTVLKRLHPCSSRKRHVEVPTLAQHKALKVSAGSTAQWVTEAQTAKQHGVASARADPKEPDAQGEAAEAAMEQAEEEPMPREAEDHESTGAKVPSVAQATEVKAPRTSEAEATEAEVPRTIEAVVAEAGAPETTKAGAMEAGEQVASLAARVKELEEELTRVASDRNTFRSRAKEATASTKALAGQLGTEQGAHLLTKGALAKALKVAKASRTEAMAWKGKVDGLEKEAFVVVQVVLEAKIERQNALWSAARTAYEALEVEGV